MAGKCQVSLLRLIRDKRLPKPKHHRSNSKSRREKSVYRPFKRRSEVGGLPGHFSHAGPSSETPATIVNCVSFDASACEEVSCISVAKIQSREEKTGRVTWIDVIGLADEAAIECIGKRYGIHPLLLEDIVHTHQRPKVEVQEGRLIVILRIVDPTAPLVSEQISFLLCGSTVITFQEKLGDCFEPVRRRIREKLGSIRTQGADYLMYALIDTVIDGFFPLMEDYGRTLEALEDAVDAGINSEVQQNVHSIRSELSQLRKIAWSHRETMQRLVNEAEDLMAPTTIPFLRDCLDHTGQVLDVAETFRDVAGDLRDLYFTALSQRTNEVMKFLTIISTIFMPLSFLAGLYGMNFNAEVSPFNMPETQSRYGYPLLLVVMFAVVVAMLSYFYRKGWLYQKV